MTVPVLLETSGGVVSSVDTGASTRRPSPVAPPWRWWWFIANVQTRCCKIKKMRQPFISSQHFISHQRTALLTEQFPVADRSRIRASWILRKSAWNMKASEVGVEELPLSQPPQQRRSPHHPRTKRKDEGKMSTAEVPQDQQLKPSEFGGPSRSSLSSMESTEVVHVRRPSSTGQPDDWEVCVVWRVFVLPKMLMGEAITC